MDKNEEADFLARVVSLEAAKTRRKHQTEDEAFDRLWRALDAGLMPGAPTPASGGFARCETALVELDDRLTAGTDTGTDTALLARLPADSLAVWAGGVSARDFVATFARVFRDF